MERYSVNIKQISWLDREGLEAEVLCEVNEAQLWAFCHPCSFRRGETANVYFDFVQEKISEAAFWNENKESRRVMVPSQSTKWRYYCYAQIKSIHPVVVDCGSITLSFGDWINDERVVGSYIYFVVSRLDVSKI
ncbi:MAG: hypothetical protein WDO14_19300 [Bacteroidota bacterium]